MLKVGNCLGYDNIDNFFLKTQKNLENVRPVQEQDFNSSVNIGLAVEDNARPPQLATFDVEEQLSSVPLLDGPTSHPMRRERLSMEKDHFRRMYPWCRSCSHCPKLTTTG